MKQDILKILKISELKESPWQGRFLSVGSSDKDQLQMMEVGQLAESIRLSGLMQPITVRQLEKGVYELVDGHRRVAACRLLGLGNIKAIVKPYTEKEAQLFSIVGNLQRKNLNAIELAVSFQKVLDSELFKDKKELSEAIGKDETYVGDVLNTLKMDDRIVADLARTNAVRDVRLLRLIRKIEAVDQTQTSYKQWALYMRVVKEKLGRVDVARIIKEASQKKPRKKRYAIQPGARHVTVRLHTGKLSPEQLARIVSLLEDKMLELSKELVK